jgi:hypothetical protein
MRKGVMGVALVLAIATVPATADATHSAGGGPDKDFVVGTGGVAFGPIPATLHVNVDDTPAGDGNLGRFRATLGLPTGEVTVHGDTTCLAVVSGDEARAGGIVTASSSPLVPPGTNVLGRFIDHGESNANDAPDSATGQLAPPGAAQVCAQFTQPTSAVTRGDFVVHKATP